MSFRCDGCFKDFNEAPVKVLQNDINGPKWQYCKDCAEIKNIYGK